MRCESCDAAWRGARLSQSEMRAGGLIKKFFNEELNLPLKVYNVDKLTLAVLKESKEFNDSFFKNHHINQAIKYLKLGIEKC